MGLARMLPRTEVLVVTTPPVAAQKVAARTADMARKGYLRVAGVIENMSDFTCEHGTTYALFGSGGGARLAADVGVPLIGRIPLHPVGGRRRGRRQPRWPSTTDQPLAKVFDRHRRVGDHHQCAGGVDGGVQRPDARSGGGGGAGRCPRGRLHRRAAGPPGTGAEP
jgi:hypothetical protein